MKGLDTTHLYIGIAGLLFLSSCARDAADPFTLTPTTSSASWSPLKGSTLVSAKYCQTVLPTHFGSCELSVAELIDIALQNNPSTKQTWANARAAAAQYGQSLSSFYPALAFNGSYERQKGATLNTFVPGFITQAGPDVTLSYTLFDFGQRTSAAMVAREMLYYADLNHNQELQIVIQTVMDDSYNYLYQRAVLRANQANLENAKTALDAANEKFSLGLAALGDVAQARTQYLQSKIDLTTQRQNVEDAFAQLAVDLGLPATIVFQVQSLPEQIVANPILESVESLVATAQTRRQDFLAAQANVKSKEALVLNAKRAIYPVITSDLDLGHYWFNKGLEDKGMHWSVALNLSFPIFQGFYYKNGVRSAEATLELSRAQMMQVELSVIQNVTTAHMGIKTSAQNLADSEEYLQSAELEFDIALTSYKAGTGTILDVMSAQSSLADARSKKAGSQKNWFTSLAALAYATGSLCINPCQEEK
ncbi:MAG: TolC family protein [Chlamydiia bacterium]|nr:TolC family protein [Chlamydiia bacterium]